MSAHVLDIGTLIKIDVQMSVQDATKLEIRYKKPDKTTGAWTAQIFGVNEPSVLSYTIQAGDLDQPGVWELQPYVESPNWTGTGQSVNLTILKNI